MNDVVNYVEFTEEKVTLIKNTICKGSTNDELALFLHYCKNSGLDPLARQIYAVKRWDKKSNREVMSIQVSIDGFRLIAHRTGKYAGRIGPYWCGKDGVWRDVWLEKEYPSAARVGIIREDFKEPCWGTARWDSFVQTTKEGKPTAMWHDLADIMIAKCAESQALRAAFPQDLSGLYTQEEMMNVEAVIEDIEKPALMRITSSPVVAEPVVVKPDVIKEMPISEPEHESNDVEPYTIGFVTWKQFVPDLAEQLRLAKSLKEINGWVIKNATMIGKMKDEQPTTHTKFTAMLDDLRSKLK